ncbi:hypothetical protein WG954_16945 [Lacibacter sp. H375]|uniref:hypothetical protein n=1 Tax=Lacibacter sp. H375 TaxID=3133424 RepID=UPI0030BFB6BE
MQHLMLSINKSLQIKLKRLVTFLNQVHKEFEDVAEEIDNNNLKTALQALAVESCQYASEINNELMHFHISLQADYTDQAWKEIEKSITDDERSLTEGGEIAAICKNCESRFNKLYEEALAEFIPDKNLQDMITYQLYATRLAFKKIMLLNKLRFNHY